MPAIGNICEFDALMKRKSRINHILWMYLIFGCEDDSSTLTHKERDTSAVTWNVYGVSKIRQRAGITRDSSRLWCVDLPESISTRKSIQTHVIKIHWIFPFFNMLELQLFSPFYALFSYIQHVVCSAWAEVLCFSFILFTDIHILQVPPVSSRALRWELPILINIAYITCKCVLEYSVVC